MTGKEERYWWKKISFLLPSPSSSSSKNASSDPSSIPYFRTPSIKFSFISCSFQFPLIFKGRSTFLKREVTLTSIFPSNFILARTSSSSSPFLRYRSRRLFIPRFDASRICSSIHSITLLEWKLVRWVMIIPLSHCSIKF